MTPTVALIRKAMAERADTIRGHALLYLQGNEMVYSRELHAVIASDACGVDITVGNVARELRAMETEGLLESWLTPAGDAPRQRMIRRYYRLKEVRST